MALTRAMKQILWMYAAMDEVGYPQPKPAILYNDNLGAVVLMQKTKNNIKVKHINTSRTALANVSHIFSYPNSYPLI